MQHVGDSEIILMLGLRGRSNIIYKLGSVLLWNVLFLKAFCETDCFARILIWCR